MIAVELVAWTRMRRQFGRSEIECHLTAASRGETRKEYSVARTIDTTGNLDFDSDTMTYGASLSIHHTSISIKILRYSIHSMFPILRPPKDPLSGCLPNH